MVQNSHSVGGGIPAPGPVGMVAVSRGTGSRFARLGSAWGPLRSDLEVVQNPTPYTTNVLNCGSVLSERPSEIDKTICLSKFNPLYLQ